MRQRFRRWLAAGMVLVLASLARAETPAPPEFAPEEVEFFEKRVRPILVTRCLECHSAKLDEPKGGLRLDTRAASLAGGETGPAVVPGKPKESLLVDAVNYGDLFQMPPKSKLPDEEVAVLTRWVEMGAPWPAEKEEKPTAVPAGFDLAARKASHWCWQPIADPPVPEVQRREWVKSSIDAFILAKLEAKGLAPNPPADKRVLLRRVYLDLVGLPPSVEATEAFLADESPDALAKVVDELLRSPHFGERWGRHWLDLVRYAESRGHEFDYDIPNVWHYRDYVIRALNDDVPYDQFVLEHIAGDLLEKPRLHPQEGFNESVLATGFWHLGEWVHSPVDIRKDECDRFDNMVDVFSKTFLAMTVSCARCHDHKFDAISQKDYYALFGYLQSSHYRQARFDAMVVNREVARELAKLDEQVQSEVRTLYREAYQPNVASIAEYVAAAARTVAEGKEAKSVAAEAKLDVGRLEAWIGALKQVRDDADHLLHPLAQAVLDGSAGDGARLREAVGRVAEIAAAETKQQHDAWAQAKVIVDYGAIDATGWLVDGHAFGPGPVRAGEWLLGTDGQLPLVREVARHGMARRDLRWKGLTKAPGTQGEPGGLGRFESAGQTVRTPTFEVTTGKMAYLVQGSGRAFAAVDSHRLLNGPLHGQTILEWNDEPRVRWVTQNLSAYVGHRVHIEFSPRGDGELRVLQVIEGDPPPVPHVTPVRGLAAGLGDERPENTAQLGAALAKAVEKAVGEKLSPPEVQARWTAWLIEHPELLLNAAEQEKFTARLREVAERYQRQSNELERKIRRPSRTAPAMWDGDSEDERLLVRGNHVTPKDIVPRRFLSAIVGEAPAAPAVGSGRLELAQAVLAPENPLTARVMANRVWHHLLGRGIVPSTDNFGVLGLTPSHPELLDHLATQFRREGWSLKRLIRSIVLSNTYQMASTPSDAGNQLDPQNLLWHRANIRRLDAEVIRDQILAISGRLDTTMYGPSVPVHLTPFMQGRGRPQGGPLDGQGRRSIYIAVRRNFLSPMMLAFDAPIPATTIGTRNRSNVPAQALTLMNDPFVVEQARLWGKRLAEDASLGSAEARIRRLYQEAFTRPPTEEELAAAQAFLDAQGKEYQLPAEQARTDARVWGDLCHVMMNVKEFIFIP